jgi:hypothetical protein
MQLPTPALEHTFFTFATDIGVSQCYCNLNGYITIKHIIEGHFLDERNRIDNNSVAVDNDFRSWSYQRECNIQTVF